MSAKLTPEQQEALDEAFAALQPSYDPGDDGDAVRLALNAIAGILGERSEIVVGDDDGLIDVLDALDADEDLQTDVAALYGTAADGAYGEGLSKKDAKKINGLLEGIEEPIRRLIRKARPAGKAKVSGRRSKKS